MIGDDGAIEIAVPRDRNGSFEPQIVAKGQTRLDGFDERIISLYARGLSVREIQAHLQELYGVEVSPDLISRVTRRGARGGTRLAELTARPGLSGNYEAPVFEWLKDCAAKEYDMIIEIGANVGIYTVFLDALIKAGRSRFTKVIAFEPSREAYRRLLENLRANNARHVVAFQADIGLTSGLQSFFEPAAHGHLTNGSFIREFAAIFSETVSESVALVVGVQELEKYLKESNKTLIKMKVERFEPALIAAFEPLINKYRPDLLIAVLNVTADQLDKTTALSGYRKFLITPQGLRELSSLFASSKDRDWFLQFCGKPTPRVSGCPR